MAGREGGDGRWPTGVASLDRLLGGGLEGDSLTEIYGEGGSGKTVFCLALAVRAVAEGRWVLYIDTEGVSPHRLAATAAGLAPGALDRLLVVAPPDLASQNRAVHRARLLASDAERPVGLIVVDSLTRHYRLARTEDDEDEARRSLADEIAELAFAARRGDLPVVFTNQVYQSRREETLEPIAGLFLQHAAKTILRFDRSAGSLRQVTLMKHRDRPPGTASFRITDRGIEDAGRDGPGDNRDKPPSP
ncbi:MAG: DNA repair and recombination protein RadB [Thermoplasmata archaeon]